MAQKDGRLQRQQGGRIRCKHCNTVIESTHVHDFKYCPCGKVFVDGGPEYMRFGFPQSPWQDHLEILHDPTPPITPTTHKTKED